MANDPRYYDEPPMEQGPNYKMLFLGACALITFLSGTIFRIWDSRSEQAAEDSRTTNQLQWERLQQHSERLSDHTAAIQQLRREGDDWETRLRKLEEWRYARR